MTWKQQLSNCNELLASSGHHFTISPSICLTGTDRHRLSLFSASIWKSATSCYVGRRRGELRGSGPNPVRQDHHRVDGRDQVAQELGLDHGQLPPSGRGPGLCLARRPLHAADTGRRTARRRSPLAARRRHVLAQDRHAADVKSRIL